MPSTEEIAEAIQASNNFPVETEEISTENATALGEGIEANDAVNDGDEENGSNVSGEHSENGASNSVRSWKEMLQIVKKLHNDAGKLHDKISGLHSNFSELTVMATSLFDATTVQILTDGCPEIGGLRDPHEVHFTRQEVEDAYADLSQSKLLVSEDMNEHSVLINYS